MHTFRVDRARVTSALRAVLVALGATAIAGCVRPAARPPAPSDLSPALRAFEERTRDYAERIHRLAAKEAPLPRRATADQVAVHEKRLAAAIRAERAGARRGDLFTPEASAEVCAIARRALAGPLGQSDRKSLGDESPAIAPLEVNGPYPESLPVATMPPYLLHELPRLPPDLEYRVVGSTLLVHDARADVVLDWAPGCLRKQAAAPGAR